MTTESKIPKIMSKAFSWLMYCQMSAMFLVSSADILINAMATAAPNNSNTMETVVEVGMALLYEFVLMDALGLPRIPLMIFVTLASLFKAYWIMKVFMHVGHEKRGFVFTLLFPFVFLVWGIISFAADGAHYGAMREILNGIFY